MKKYIAECLGTFVLTFLGCGTAMFLGCGTPAGLVGTAIAFGLAVVAMAYTIGGISGCHINPAITLGVALSGRMSWKDACGYWCGQIIGGILAGACLLLVANVVTPDLGAFAGANPAGLGANGVAHAGGAGGAFLVEVIATFLFVLVVLGTTDAKVGAGNFAGLAIGLALQGSLSNFASGVMLICFRPVKVGEYITGGGAEGTVQEISIFSTTILTVDNKVIVVPNSAILNGNIVNFSRMPERRVDMSFSVSYGADFREVKKLLTKIADSNDKIIHDDKHAYGIVVTDLAAPVMKIAVRVWVKNADYFDVLGKFTEDAKLAFDANKVAPAAVPSLNVLNSK